MKNLVLTLTLIFASVFTFAQKLTLDPNHAKLQFEVTHMTISNVDGEFKKFDVKLENTQSDFFDAKFTVTADINSIDTGIEKRDEHLKSPDFFDAKKYPSLKFVTTSFVKGNNNNYTLTGNLTLHGVTKPVTLNVKYNGNVVNPMSKKKTYGFTVTGSFKRSDFSLGSNFPEAVLSDAVQISSNLEFVAE